MFGLAFSERHCREAVVRSDCNHESTHCQELQKRNIDAFVLATRSIRAIRAVAVIVQRFLIKHYNAT